MKIFSKRLFSVLLSFTLCIYLFAPGTLAEDNTEMAIPDIRDELTKSNNLLETINPDDTVTVIVELESESTLDVDEYTDTFKKDSMDFSVSSHVTAFREDILEEQTAVQKQIAEMIPDAEFRYNYTNLLNGFAVRVQHKDIESIKNLEKVLDVYMTQSYIYDVGWDEDNGDGSYISLENYYDVYGGDGIRLADNTDAARGLFSNHGSADQMSLQKAWDAGYTGAGKVVGIFDSSLRYTHELFSYMDSDITDRKPGNYKTKEDLRQIVNANESTLNLFDSGWGNWFHQREDTGFGEEVQSKIKNGEFHYSEKIPFAVDYMDGDLEVWDGDSSSHGTHVAGIAAGNPGPIDSSRPMGFDNADGVLGAAYDSQIMFFKVFSETDSFKQEADESVFAALDDAVTLGVNAFNLSLGIPNGFTTMNTYAQAGYQRAYNRAAAAGISIAVSAGNDSRESRLGSLVNGLTTILPNNYKIGFSGSLFAPMTVASAQSTGYQIDNITGEMQTYPDLGPSSFTSWGMTEALRLKPDIMAPGESILSAGGEDDEDLRVKSGTSMASPVVEGALILIQQYVDENLGLFGVRPGTQEYTDLINQLSASTAAAYRPYTDRSYTERQNLYFSPRRQGAGMIDVGSAVESEVVLYSDIKYDAETGEAPRTKAELSDGLENNFSFSFMLKNYGENSREFDVLACLQTDAVSVSSGRNVLEFPNSHGIDIDAIENAAMTVKAVDGGAIATNSDNINRYSDNPVPAVISVPGKSEVRITVEVELNAETMAKYDEVYPNGMFLEGYVFFDSQRENLSIPFVGFRGDWNRAPIFDLATAYDDISGKNITDADYPLFHTSSLNSQVKSGDGSIYEVVLGANQYSKNIWPGYNSKRIENMAEIRDYFDAVKNENSFSSDYAAISNNNDGFLEEVYADLALLRNAKAVCVVIEDSSGNTVKTLGPEFEFFKTHATDNNMTQQVAATYGTKYNRDMAWDGTDSKGNPVKDGQYSYKVIAMTEYEFLNTPECIPSGNSWGNNGQTLNKSYKDRVMKALQESPTAQSISMDVKVDNINPKIQAEIEGSEVKVQVTDEGSGLQAAALYYDGELAAPLKLLSGTNAEFSFDISGIKDFDEEKLNIQAADYAVNVGIKNFKQDIIIDEKEEAPYMSGFPGNTFQPDGLITRAQTVAILYNLYGEKPETHSVLGGFADISSSHWAADAMVWAIEEGYIKGDKDSNSVRPNDTITRGELASVIAHIDKDHDFTSKLDKPATVPEFSDVNGHWAKNSIEFLAGCGVISGYGDNTFKPGNPIKRCETVVMVAILIGRSEEFDTGISFTDLESSHWAYGYIMNAVNGIKK